MKETQYGELCVIGMKGCETFAEQVDAVLAGAGKQKRWVFISHLFIFTLSNQ